MIDSIMNFREYSIYRTKDGKNLKRGKLYRSGRLYEISKEDLEELESLNLDYILDFRAPQEVESLPDPEVKNATHIAVPLYQNIIENYKNYNPETQKGFEKLLDSATKEKEIESYRLLPFNNPCIRYTLETALQSERGFLIHCSAGKDRAGMCAAALLLALGVDRETVIQDYLKSGYEYDRLMKSIFTGATEEEILKYTPMIHYIAVCDPDYIKAALDAIDEKYSSYEEYLEKEYDFTEEKRNELRKKYVEL